MKFTNVKQLIIKFMGGGLINFPTRFLRWVKINGDSDGSDDGGGDDSEIDWESIYREQILAKATQQIQKFNPTNNPNAEFNLAYKYNNNSWDISDATYINNTNVLPNPEDILIPDKFVKVYDNNSKNTYLEDATLEEYLTWNTLKFDTGWRYEVEIIPLYSNPTAIPNKFYKLNSVAVEGAQLFPSEIVGLEGDWYIFPEGG